MKLFLLILFFFLPLLTHAEDNTKRTITGIVIDNSTSKPIERGIVMLLSKNKLEAMQVVDSTGIFIFNNIDLDRFNLQVKRVGYFEFLAGPFPVSKLDTFKVIVKLEPAYLLTDPVEITAKRTVAFLEKEGFYRRMDEGWARGLTPEDLQDKHYGKMADMLRTIPGVVLTQSKDGWILTSTRSHITGLHDTAPVNIYLDGFNVEEFSSIEHFNPGDIAAVEFYRGGFGVPGKFGGAWRPGGTLILWTKR